MLSGWPAWSEFAVQMTDAQWVFVAVFAVIVVIYAATLGGNRSRP